MKATTIHSTILPYYHARLTVPQQLGTDYTGRVTSLVMIGKSVCPSCQKPRERLKNICVSEIYRSITLLSASTVDSIYNEFYIVFYRVAPRHSVPLDPRKTRKQRTRFYLFILFFLINVFSFFPGDEPARGEELICAVYRCTLRNQFT